MEKIAANIVMEFSYGLRVRNVLQYMPQMKLDFNRIWSRMMFDILNRFTFMTSACTASYSERGVHYSGR